MQCIYVFVKSHATSSYLKNKNKINLSIVVVACGLTYECYIDDWRSTVNSEMFGIISFSRIVKDIFATLKGRDLDTIYLNQ